MKAGCSQLLTTLLILFMVKTMKSSLFKCCLAILALAALNVLVPVAYAQSPVSGGVSAV
jgi:hypothetical protein